MAPGWKVSDPVAREEGRVGGDVMAWAVGRGSLGTRHDGFGNPQWLGRQLVPECIGRRVELKAGSPGVEASRKPRQAEQKAKGHGH